MADIKSAIELEKKVTRAGGRQALRELLQKTVAEYNRLCTNRRHKIDSHRRALIYNLSFISI